MPKVYDELGTNPDNHIQNEIKAYTTLRGGLGCFLAEQTFYKKDLVVKAGTNLLKPNEDYFYSPVYIPVLAATGLEAFSYFYIKPDVKTRFPNEDLDISYRCVGGGHTDTTLLAAITNMTSNTTLDDWASITTTFKAKYRTFDAQTYERGTLEVVAALLSDIKDELEQMKQTSNLSLATRITAIEQRLTAGNL